MAGQKPRPRMTAYAFYLQMVRVQHASRNPRQQAIPLDEIARIGGERWEMLDEFKKIRFKQMEESDSTRYEKEFAAFKKITKKSKKAAKDPNAPKGPCGSYMFFANAQRKKVSAANPDFKATEIAKELGRMWKDVSPTEKAYYEQLAADDKERFTKEKDAYDRKQNVIVPKEQLNNPEPEDSESEADSD